MHLPRASIVPSLLLLGCLVSLNATSARAGSFESLGNPVVQPLLMGVTAGVNATNGDALYFNLAQTGSRLLLVQVEPATGQARQFSSPVGEGAWAMITGPDQRVYLGTWESGYLLKFDPRQPDQGLVSLGKPSPTETYIWELALATDGNLYGCTYPQAKLVRYNLKTGQSEDLGRMDPSEMYARSVAADTNGNVYVGIGTVKQQVVRFHIATGGIKPLIPEAERLPGTARVWKGSNGCVYAHVLNKHLRCDGDKLVPAEPSLPSPPPVALRDGRQVGSRKVQKETLAYELKDASGKTTQHTAPFEGTGSRLFVVGAGPKGRIYGSTFLPLEMFDYNPATGQSRHLGNPTDVGGEIYSFATDGRLLFLCAYPSSFLSLYDPDKPWNYGRQPTNNPYGFGPMGDGHLRPQALIHGPDGRIYVGSLPPYGQTGGALGVFDPKQNKVVENYRNLIPDQGIVALCHETETDLIFGGSSIEGGGGAKPVARRGVLFAWDYKARQKVWETELDDTRLIALTAAHGKIFGVSRPSNTLLVLDAKTRKIERQEKIPFGPVREISLGYHPAHDRIYGLAGNSLVAVDPRTYALTEVAKCPDPITCGFAITETGVYFGSNIRLMRWKW